MGDGMPAGGARRPRERKGAEQAMKTGAFGVVLGIATWAAVLSGQAARVGGGDIRFEPEGVAPVVFSHERHVAGAKLVCRSCHDRLFVTRAKHKPVTMEQMAEKGLSCGACHDGKTAFATDDCERCHAS